MSKRKRDKARLQRQLQGTDINILIGYPENLMRTPEGSTIRYTGDPERIESTWRPLQQGVTARGSTGTLYGPPEGYREVTVLGQDDTHVLAVEIKHAGGRFSIDFEAANYSACARKAWSTLREMDLTKKDREYVERNDHRTLWFVETDAEVTPPKDA